jgi:hypothetical protein
MPNKPGIGVLALAGIFVLSERAEGQIVYTPANTSVSCRRSWYGCYGDSCRLRDEAIRNKPTTRLAARLEQLGSAHSRGIWRICLVPGQAAAWR